MPARYFASRAFVVALHNVWTAMQPFYFKVTGEHGNECTASPLLMKVQFSSVGRVERSETPTRIDYVYHVGFRSALPDLQYST